MCRVKERTGRPFAVLVAGLLFGTLGPGDALDLKRSEASPRRASPLASALAADGLHEVKNASWVVGLEENRTCQESSPSPPWHDEVQTFCRDRGSTFMTFSDCITRVNHFCGVRHVIRPPFPWAHP